MSGILKRETKIVCCEPQPPLVVFFVLVGWFGGRGGHGVRGALWGPDKHEPTSWMANQKQRLGDGETDKTELPEESRERSKPARPEAVVKHCG